MVAAAAAAAAAGAAPLPPPMQQLGTYPPPVATRFYDVLLLACVFFSPVPSRTHFDYFVVIIPQLSRCSKGGTRALAAREIDKPELWQRVNQAEEEHDHAAEEKAVARLRRLEKL